MGAAPAPPGVGRAPRRPRDVLDSGHGRPLVWAGARTVAVASDTALWHHDGPPPAPPRRVLIRDPQGEFVTQELPSTDVAADPAQILPDARCAGVETQRRRSDLAILRTTPALLGLFALVTLRARPHTGPSADVVRQVA